jgi:hypothetical protein
LAAAILTVGGLWKVFDASLAFNSGGDIAEDVHRSAGLRVAAILIVCALIAHRGERLTHGVTHG